MLQVFVVTTHFVIMLTLTDFIEIDLFFQNLSQSVKYEFKGILGMDSNSTLKIFEFHCVLYSLHFHWML